MLAEIVVRGQSSKQQKAVTLPSIIPGTT